MKSSSWFKPPKIRPLWVWIRDLAYYSISLVWIDRKNNITKCCWSWISGWIESLVHRHRHRPTQTEANQRIDNLRVKSYTQSFVGQKFALPRTITWTTVVEVSQYKVYYTKYTIHKYTMDSQYLWRAWIIGLWAFQGNTFLAWTFIGQWKKWI